MWRQLDDEARGAHGMLLVVVVPIFFAALIALVWLVPAAIMAVTGPSTASTEDPGGASSWIAGERPGSRPVVPPAPTEVPEAGTGTAETPASEAEQPASEAEQPAAGLPTEAGTDAAGQSKTLGQVMDGSTVLRTGDTGLPVRFVQQRLNAAGINVPETATFDEATVAAVTRVQEKFELTQTGRVNRYTLDTLLRITERGPALPGECTAGTVVCIDKTQRLVRLVRDGQVVMSLDARFGALGAATKEGAFEVYDKRADDWSTEFGVPMQYSLYFAGGQAVHYSEVFAAQGYAGGSAGCVNTRDLAGSQALFDQVPRGTKVFVYR